MRKKCLSLTFALAACGLARAQAPPPPTPLAQLLAEADRNNPGIGAARLAWQAATHAIAPASTLPDPEVSLQQVSVGNPLPFAGYTTRNFAYIGVGVSQALPYPGKLRLRGEIARSDADASRAALEGVRRAVHEQLEEAYAELAYLQATGIILQRDQDLLGRMAQLAEERYATGQIAQSEVLAAQLEQTTTLRDLAMHRQQLDIVQARLRELLGRGAAAAPIAATRLEENKLAARAVPPLLPASDPRLEAQQALVARRHASVELAHKNFLPDFTAQYMYQRTASRFPDYYQWTLGVSVPIHKSRRQKQELAEASAESSSAQSAYEATRAEDEYAANEQWITIQADEQVLDLYRGGLLPQANARLQSALTAFESNRDSLRSVLEAYRAQLDLEREYWHTLADHETALAKLQALTGPLPMEAAHD